VQTLTYLQRISRYSQLSHLIKLADQILLVRKERNDCWSDSAAALSWDDTEAPMYRQQGTLM